MNSNKTLPKTLGILYILAFLTYGGGNGLVESALNAPDYHENISVHLTRIIAGVMLMSLVHSAIIIGIGVLMMAVLAPHSRAVAYGYLSAIIATSVLLTTGTVFLLLQATLRQPFPEIDLSQISFLDALGFVLAKGNFYAYQLGMAVWSVAGLFFCRILYRTKLIPKWVAAWGLAGYGVFLVGCLLEISGLPVGLMLSVPGGLFEIVLALLLIFKGFRKTNPVPVVF